MTSEPVRICLTVDVWVLLITAGIVLFCAGLYLGGAIREQQDQDHDG